MLLFRRLLRIGPVLDLAADHGCVALDRAALTANRAARLWHYAFADTMRHEPC